MAFPEHAKVVIIGLGGIVGAVAGHEISSHTGGSKGNQNVAAVAGAAAGALSGLVVGAFGYGVLVLGAAVIAVLTAAYVVLDGVRDRRRTAMA